MVERGRTTAIASGQPRLGKPSSAILSGDLLGFAIPSCARFAIKAIDRAATDKVQDIPWDGAQPASMAGQQRTIAATFAD